MMREIHGVAVPAFFYGTAWKEQRTAPLTTLALEQGFRAIDTANQRKHYFEAAVGEALAPRLAAGERDQLFLQTKFTYQRGQDHRLPYDPAAAPGEQVAQSFASSLEHLGVERVDSYVLHGPERARGISPVDREVWSAMETLADSGRVRLLGVSNVSAEQLEALCGSARVAPAFVQNRCYARAGWDRDVRRVCARRGVCYQGFSLLTANRVELSSPAVVAAARARGVSVEQLTFRLAAQLGMIPLTGTSSADHMREDLLALEMPPLDEAELAAFGAVV